MSQANRVFITGRSALTASGATADETWNAIISGQCGIDEINFGNYLNGHIVWAEK